jgi:hypothetical protein
VYQFKCAYCGKTFLASRSHARYCSKKCCLYARRQRERSLGVKCGTKKAADGSKLRHVCLPEGQDVDPCGSRGGFSAAAISRHVSDAHGMVAYFDAAAGRGPRDAREACEHISRGFERTLREVGL